MDDRDKLATIRLARDDNATRYFARHAEEWDELRRLHSPDTMVEEALRAMFAGSSLGRVLDIGTGTGRMAELFAEQADSIVALDNNLEMLRIARAKLQHLPAERIELVQGDFTNLPFASAEFDTVLLHQVLHFAQDPAIAIAEASRVARPGGRVAIVDFALHDHEELRESHAHTRLGFEDGQMKDMLHKAGFEPRIPRALDGGELTVKIWLGTRRGRALSEERRAG